MLTKLTVRNFKRFRQVEVELGNPVVLIGPNNSGKTTALQALALWETGLRRWNEKRGGKQTPKQRPAVAINRRDLVAIPVPFANLLWRDLHVRDVNRTPAGAQNTKNIRIDIEVEGVSGGHVWNCGLEFDYANEESLYCRPLRLSEEKNPPRMPVPEETSDVRVAYLPPMSGLADREFEKQSGEVRMLIGQGRTAEVLRNLCWRISQDDRNGRQHWENLVQRIHQLFGVTLDVPDYTENNEVILKYRDASGVELDLSSAGRGLHQTLLLLAYMTANPGSVLLLDEPDAHLEILRQRQIYRVLTEVAREQGNQIIAASHSEVVLREAAAKDVVVAFVGRPHRINDQGSQVMKALRDIGFEDYYQAEQKGWVLYLEGPTDLAILQAFAGVLEHPAAADLERPFVQFVENQPAKARDHFYGLREAKADLLGFVLRDRSPAPVQSTDELREHMWSRREIENYLCQPETLLSYADTLAPGPLFNFREAMQECIGGRTPPDALRDPNDNWWREVKASDEYLNRLFQMFFQKLSLPNLIWKTNYHVLARLAPRSLIDPEVSEVLDAIHTVARRARPAEQE